MEEFVQLIVSNPQHVMLYGAEAQKSVSTFADSILAEVKHRRRRLWQQLTKPSAN